MTRIITNKLLNPTTRVIKNWNQDFRTSDGPNTSSFISLSDLAIPYDSYYTSRIVLPANTTDYYLNYNLLENTTFLLIKVTYNGNYDFVNEDSYDPIYYYEPNNYNINYYYEGNSGITYPINRLLILNSSFTNKLSKIYLNNSLDYDVVLDVFQADISAPIPRPPSSAVTFSNLYYNDIITDQITCLSNTGITGSSQFIISEYVMTFSGYTVIQHYIPFSLITDIQRDFDNNIISIITLSTFYTLKFLTDFHFNQAYSRILFAFTSFFDGSCRYLTNDYVFKNGEIINCSSGYTGVNINPPTIYYNNSGSGGTWVGGGITIPYNIYLDLIHNNITGWTSDNLKILFISGITDCFDGNISFSDITFSLYKKGSPVPLTGITSIGIYDINIVVTDSASNTTISDIVNINVNDTTYNHDTLLPIIYYKPFILDNTLTGNTNFFTGVTSGITSDIYIESGFTFGFSGATINFFDGIIDRLDIIDNVIDYVYDIVNMTNKYMLDVLIIDYSNVYTEVTQIGNYLVKFSINGSDGNQVESYFIMRVI